MKKVVVTDPVTVAKNEVRDWADMIAFMLSIVPIVLDKVGQQ